MRERASSRRIDRHNTIHYELAVAAPGNGTDILQVMKLHLATAAHHESLGDGGIGHGEFELVRLHGIGRFGAQAVLDQFALIGLEDIAFLNQVVQLPRLDPSAKNKIITHGEKKNQTDDDQRDKDQEKFFHNNFI